jgi:hypothetical protein
VQAAGARETEKQRSSPTEGGRLGGVFTGLGIHWVVDGIHTLCHKRHVVTYGAFHVTEDGVGGSGAG